MILFLSLTQTNDDPNFVWLIVEEYQITKNQFSCRIYDQKKIVKNSTILILFIKHNLRTNCAKLIFILKQNDFKKTKTLIYVLYIVRKSFKPTINFHGVLIDKLCNINNETNFTIWETNQIRIMNLRF